jgi:hypothetical protein
LDARSINIDPVLAIVKAQVHRRVTAGGDNAVGRGRWPQLVSDQILATGDKFETIFTVH